MADFNYVASGGITTGGEANPITSPYWTAPIDEGLILLGGEASGNGLTSNSSAITFNQASGSWGTITHIAIVDSATHGAGNVLFHGALAVSKTVNSGDTFSFQIGDLQITLA